MAIGFLMIKGACILFCSIHHQSKMATMVPAIGGGIEYGVKLLSGIFAIIRPPSHYGNEFLSLSARVECLQHTAIHAGLALCGPLIGVGASIVVPLLGVADVMDKINQKKPIAVPIAIWAGATVVSVIGIVGIPVLHVVGVVRSLLASCVHPAIYLNK
jgi:hypothetical protein